MEIGSRLEGLLSLSVAEVARRFIIQQSRSQ
jgi:hypothetical protein